MSENNTTAQCSDAEYEAARAAGLLVVTVAEEAAVHKFAEMIRAEERERCARLVENLRPDGDCAVQYDRCTIVQKLRAR